MFDAIGIVGVGLIGGSIALDAKSLGLTKKILGFDKDEGVLDRALQLGVIDKKGDGFDVGECDLVIVATPVRSIPSVLRDVFGKAKDGSIVIDVGSVKKPIVDSVTEFLEENVYYVPVHPIAGIERFGINAATNGLFRNAYCIITPFNGMNKEKANIVGEFLEKLGMKLIFMEPKLHDEVFGFVSHLPHAIAYTLVGLAAKKNENYRFIGGGFRDYTRVASSSEKMWSDIFFMNKVNLIASIEDFIGELFKLKNKIEKNDYDGVIEYLKMARLFRESLDG
ncbi:prephenate dehydrogenase [Hippea maritima]|uniref:Prephenate dehydrogenase n=1 Tax=Hippea maritima (strain ATCC 700847 / DSM 10411 / MH2) TaxID=760142 RepID=F2LW76_HIPMA|nr:prephenate dehydrogenase/arogenate dehydrogenase family protein [Hippea maritima]AEA34010.1 Prephenate dehydrogenase [Hippea maritima DSM 10411]